MGFQAPDGRQYVLNAAGKRVNEVWHLPAEECEEPAADLPGPRE